MKHNRHKKFAKLITDLRKWAATETDSEALEAAQNYLQGIDLVAEFDIHLDILVPTPDEASVDAWLDRCREKGDERWRAVCSAIEEC